VNATDGASWTKKIYTFTTKGILADPMFDVSVDDATLRTNGSGQDWYESRGAFSGGDSTLLTLDTNNIGGNTGKKASLKGYSTSSSAYLTQEFSSAQTGIFSVSLDIYIDKINDNVNLDRTGHIFLGDDSTAGNGPCATGSERFVCLAFYDSTPPGDTGDDLSLIVRNRTSQTWSDSTTWRNLASGLSYDTWYTIKLEVNMVNRSYNVFINNVPLGTIVVNNEYVSPSLTHMSFFVGGNSRGEFYVDNVYSPVIT
jgi:hypothetical protein